MTKYNIEMTFDMIREFHDLVDWSDKVAYCVPDMYEKTYSCHELKYKDLIELIMIRL